MRMHGKQLPLYQIGLSRLTQTDCHIGFPHRKVQLLIRRNQRDVDIRIKIEELAESRCQPMHAYSRRGGDLQFAIGPFTAVGQFSASRFQLHEDFMRSAIKQFTLFGEDQSARMTVKERDRQFCLERGYLPRHSGL